MLNQHFQTAAPHTRHQPLTPNPCLPFPPQPALASSPLGLYPGKQTEGLGICGEVMEARWRSVTEGVSCQIRGWVGWRGVHECPNPSHSFLKTANVSFEDIIPFGHLIALGNYEPLWGMYGITRSGYQCVEGRREFNLNSGWRFRRYIWSDMLINQLIWSKWGIWL